MTKSIKAVLIDPFQQEIYPVKVFPAKPAIARLLDCANIEAVNLGLAEHGVPHCAWVDEEAFLREPFVYPHWRTTVPDPPVLGPTGLAGYGLVTGMSMESFTLSCLIPFQILSSIVAWEPWRHRIPIDEVIPQMLRVYEIVK